MNIETAVVTFILMLVAQIPIVVAAVVGYLKNRTALETNTQITKEGTSEAAANARTAAEVALETKNATKQLNNKADTIVRQTNGGMELVKQQVAELFRERTTADAHRVKIEADLKELHKYSHDGERELRDALGVLSNQVAILVEIQKQSSSPKESKK